MNGYYGIATWLTYLNMISGVIGIGFAFAHNVTLAVICLIVSGICDMFDGTVARRFDRSHAEKVYGIQIDTLADLISFGVLPGVIGVTLGMHQFPWLLVVALYVLAALIRLAYFNVTELANLEKEESRTYYEGLPVTSVAAILPFGYLLSLWLGFSLQPAYGILLAVIAISFVSKFRIKKLKMRQMATLGAFGAISVFALIYMVALR